MATYPTQHETFVAMLAAMQRQRIEVDVRETTPPTTPTTADETARELTSTAA